MKTGPRRKAGRSQGRGGQVRGRRQERQTARSLYPVVKTTPFSEPETGYNE